jgi:hypothetical protein
MEQPPDPNEHNDTPGPVEIGDVVLRRVHEERPPTFSFIFWKPDPHNVPEVAEQLGSCDVVVLEAVGLESAAERAWAEQLCTAYLAPEHSDGQREVLRRGFGSFLGAKPALYYVTLLDRLSGTGKQVRFVDLLADEPEYKLFTGAEESAEQLQQAMVDDTKTNTALREQLTECAKDFALANMARVVSVQRVLQGYLSEPALTNARVGVVLSAAQTPVQHALRENAQTERHFVDVGTSLQRHPWERGVSSIPCCAHALVRIPPGVTCTVYAVGSSLTTDVLRSL